MTNSTIDYQEIGAQLCVARKNAGLLQADVASKLGFGVSYYCNIERGKVALSLTRLVQLCELLNVTPGTVLNRCTPGLRESGNQDGSEMNEVCDDIMNAVHRCAPRVRHSILEVVKAMEGLE